MIDLPALGIVTSSINNLFNIVQTMKDVRDAAIINAKIIDLQAEIIKAQQAVFAANQDRSALIEQNDELKNKLAKFKNWEREKKRYELKDVGTGAFAYALKASMNNAEPSHYICANCYQDRQKSILHGFLSVSSSSLNCPRCKAEIATPDPRD